ncbi:hypothetical protein RXV91_12785 [Lactiplantibacillus sp. DA1]|uniref:hypothetical protein n=1 Tax=Lactiplantibacillus sp. DA1 TaxID=3079857 RepID=UPI00292A6550|nr:hypothetical protein [Lactiplantibacillus sp. DA1]MDV0431742.1 hypothetical protein [Lactiplantibacillus sp. DA1]
MKKILVSSAVIAGIIALGGGYYLEADHQSNQSQVSETQSVVSKTKANKDTSSSATTTKKSAAAKSSSVKSSSTVASSVAESQAATSTNSRQDNNNVTASDQSQASSNQTSTTTTAGQAATSQQPATSSSQVVNSRHLTTSQINDWAWQQVAKDYQQTAVKKQDFVFNQYQNGGLVYVEVYENQNADVAHLAGRFRVNAQGQLEQQQLAQGDVWQVVATQP